MIFRRKIGVPEARGSKRLRLVKVALLAFLMTPKACFRYGPDRLFLSKATADGTGNTEDRID